jgi:membrane protein
MPATDITSSKLVGGETLTRLVEVGRRWALIVWKVAKSTGMSFYKDQGLLWAYALSYILTLSIVPILAVAFSALKGLGSANRLEPLIQHYLTLGSPNLTAEFMNLISRINAATLGGMGAAGLLLTVISTLGTIENAFNSIWRAPRGRSYLRKFTDYLSVIFTVPLLLATALSLTTSFSTRIYGVSLVVWLGPLLLLWVGFFFLFIFFPNTKVEWRPALIGSLVTSILFESAQTFYVRSQVLVRNYQVIYGALAAIPILLLWIYIAWAIILMGAELTATIQFGPVEPNEGQDTPAFARFASLFILLRIAEHMRNLRGPVTPASLAKELKVAKGSLLSIVAKLEQCGLVIESSAASDGARERGLYLCRDPATMTLYDALSCIGVEGELHDRRDQRLSALLENLERRERELLSNLTLADLLAGDKLGAGQSTVVRNSTESA